MIISKRLLSILLSALILFSCCSAALTAGAVETTAEGLYVDRVSNANCLEGEIDGLIEGGDRDNSYAWRMAERGDNIYIATARNIGSDLVDIYSPAFEAAGVSKDSLWAAIDAITGSAIPRSDDAEGANIIRYDRSRDDFEIIYTAEKGDYFRMAVTYGDSVYFGSYSAVPTNPQYILKLDADENFSKVFETTGSVSLRANCVYDDGEGDHLYFGGADDRETVVEGDPEPAAKMAILRKSNEDDTVWDRVADYRDFGDVAYDPTMNNWASSPIWELASHNGYIYATAPSVNGFVIFRGRPDDSADANEYGWLWEEIAGLNNGINNPGLSEIEGGEPGTMRSLLGSVYEFKGELYAYNFDHAFGGETAAFAGVMQQISGGDAKPGEYLNYIYNSLHNPQKVWKLNDETGVFEELTAFTELTDGTTNEYIWRMGEYADNLYITTMDAGVFYNYLTVLTNGSFFDMDSDKQSRMLDYLGDMIKLLAKAKGNELLNGLRLKLEQLKATLQSFDLSAAADTVKLTALQKLSGLKDSIGSYAEQIRAAVSSNEFISGLISRFLPSGSDLAPVGADDTEVSKGDSSLMDFVTGLMPAGFPDGVKSRIGTIAGMLSPDKIRAAVANTVRTVTDGLMTSVISRVESIYDAIDWDGIEMYLYINNAVRNNEPGFDMFRTADGESFEIITRNGFEDKYNYGSSALLATEDGLYIGTCNPFYGGQLYRLIDENYENGGNDPDEPLPVYLDDWYMVGDADADCEISILDATTIQRYLASIIDEEYIDLLAAAFSEGEVSILDATYIQRWLAGLDAPYPIGESFNRNTGDPEESIEETVLLDSEGVRIIANRLYRDLTPRIDVTIENARDKDAAVYFMPVTINGFQTRVDFIYEEVDGSSSGYIVTLPAGSAADYTLDFNDALLSRDFMSLIAEIAMTAKVIDPETYAPITSQSTVIKTSAYDSYDYSYDESGETIFDKDGVKIVYKGIDDESGDPMLYINNQSDKNIVLTAKDATINGAEADCYIGADVYSGSRALNSIWFFDSPEPGDAVELTIVISELGETYGEEAELYKIDAFSFTR